MSIYLRIPSIKDPADKTGPPLTNVIGVIDLEMIGGMDRIGIDPADPFGVVSSRLVVGIYKTTGAWNTRDSDRVATEEFAFGQGLPDAATLFSDPEFLQLYGALAAYLYSKLVMPGGPYEGAEIVGLPPA